MPSVSGLQMRAAYYHRHTAMLRMRTDSRRPDGDVARYRQTILPVLRFVIMPVSDFAAAKRGSCHFIYWRYHSSPTTAAIRFSKSD